MEFYKSYRGGDVCMYQYLQKRKLANGNVMWNHYDDAINKEAKTTNCVEGWHNALRSLFLSSHPSIWKVLRGLRKDIAVQRLSIIQAVTENGDRPKDKYKRLADRLSSKVECYAHEQDKMKYLRGVSYMT